MPKSQIVMLIATNWTFVFVLFCVVAAEWQDGMERYPFPFVNSISPYLARVNGVVNPVILPKHPSHSSEDCSFF